ncbi:MAG TPA: hypothetical protein VNZ44_01410, partial [Pyrinomonadaceae bacterium]|nr:hypothetical protein [Pyrinomonadaceae bacterium]
MNVRRITFLSLLLLFSQLPVPISARGQQQQQSPTEVQAVPAIERDEQRRVHVRLARGGRVALDNRTTGRIVVTGWDRDYIEAVATSTRGAEYVRARSEAGPSGQWVSLTADYLSQPWPDAPVIQAPPASPPEPKPTPPSEPKPQPTIAPGDENIKERERIRPFTLAGPKFGPLGRPDSVPDEIHLEVKLPRYAEIELITVNRSEVEVTGVATAVAVSGRRSTIRLRDVGAAEVRTERGAVEVDGAGGLVDVVTTGGPITVRNVRGDVRALSLNGSIEVSCVRGRVNVSNTGGPIVLANVDGDVDATTVESDVTFDGLIRAEGRYHLK